MMEEDAIAALFTPFTCKSLKLRNRLVMAPMTRQFSPDGMVTDEVAAYYRRRAEGGVGLILSEGAFIDAPSSRHHDDIPWLSGERVAPWRTIADKVHAAGAMIAPQLWHVGGAPEPRYPDSPLCADLVSPSGLIGPGLAGGRPMTEEDIADVVASFARTAAHVKTQGVDAIELHGAHGYLFDQFFWSVTNRRGDRYGGATIADRNRFAVETIRETRKAVGDDFVLLLRLSQWKMQNFQARIAATPGELEQWIGPLADAGVDIFDCSQRRFWEPEFDGSTLNLAGWARKITGRPTMTVGSIGLSNDMIESNDGAGALPAPSRIKEAAERVERGEFDLVAIGRALIADPQWPNKVRDRRFGDLIAYSNRMTATLK
jgi:2,4-dienoyl-CoA reductase-like NADH-dependent reductase (Old Yellow Enzyme family)